MKTNPLQAALLALSILSISIPPAVNAASSDRLSARSVVKILCHTNSGTMKGTGVVWPEEGTVVTALHAVAGCNRIEIYSEDQKDDTEGSVDRALYEADLALVQMADSLGIPPVQKVPSIPDIDNRFYLWGYPQVTRQISRVPLSFAGGLRSDVVKLGKAFDSEELDNLFKSQEFPNADTKIMRVSSTIQPGHSGGPIFDTAGRIVAIADGGLLGGYLSINWSIPAAIYFDQLLTANDPIPQAVSASNVLHSVAVPAKNKTIALNAEAENLINQKSAQKENSAGDNINTTEGALNLVRTFPIKDAIKLLLSDERTSQSEELQMLLEWNNELEDELKDVGEDTYDIYEDSLSGATVVIPSWMDASWDGDVNALVVNNDTDSAVMFVSLSTGTSFDNSLESGWVFLELIDKLFKWEGDGPIKTLEKREPKIYSPETEYAADIEIYQGIEPESNADGGLFLKVAAKRNVFLGAGVAVRQTDNNDSALEKDAFLMSLAAMYLTDFAVF